jgi:hypothetical protein
MVMPWLSYNSLILKKQKILGAPFVVEKGKEVWHIRCDERIEHVSGPFSEFL